MVPGISPDEAMSRLQKSTKLYELVERKYERYAGGEELFALKKTEYPALIKTKKELDNLNKLYSLYADVTDVVESWYQILWSDAESQIETMTEKLDGLEGRSMKMPKKLRNWPAYNETNKTIQDFKTVLPLLVSLSSPSVEARHWAGVMKITGKKFDVTGSEFTLQTLLEAGIAQHAEDIEEICEAAQKQLGIRNKMNDIKNQWSIADFEFGTSKNREVPLLQKVTPLLEELEEAQMNCQTMLTMRHVDPFKEQITELLTSLSDTYETAERWLKVQLLWSSLESVFLGGDIAKQLPREAKQFVKIDKEFIKIQKKAADELNIVGCCGDELLRTTLPVMIESLEKCQKALDGYLEQKRNKFPRFYFVSNPVLLQVLSQGSDPEAMQPFYEKVFDAISSVQHNEEDKSLIEGLINRKGREEEIIPLNKPVHAKGNIEEWLNVLVAEMRSTLKDITRNCAYTVYDMEDAIGDLEDFVNVMGGQFALLGIQIMWTADIEDALEAAAAGGSGGGKKNAVKDALEKTKNILLTMSRWTLDTTLSKMARTKIETNITIQVHARDVAQEINSLHKRRLLQDANSFDWQKQARFYWNDEGDSDIVDDNGCMDIRVTDVEFQYQYEYLGVKDRLAITPLTDRCYITLSQALGMCFGGAPAGPAGTGKTETVKDMGRTIGLWVCVTNCTDQQRYTDCAKIFKGLCQGGMWGCFDEFNRIRLPVLSVVAQQVLSIQNAKKSKADHFSFPGETDPIMLNASCGFFITMNPGYAGRQELPENLKALFRGVAMMVPDRQIIMKVKLCAVGYLEFVALAKKFATLYQLCEEQLSKQKHYDFGLRNILSVLRTAGQNKRDAPAGTTESELLYRTLRDMNLSKFVAQDVPLFLSLLADLFPQLTSPADSTYPEMERQIIIAINNRGLQEHRNWIKKVIQLYETTLVRHGIMLCGPSGGGKTQIFAVLRDALGAIHDIQYREQRINPKAIRAAEMYGEVDPLSQEWTTGVFAAIWEKSNRRENPYNTWIVADGPVDAIWIEDLNTVLDDNRILTLANGDRLPMTDNCKIMFENQQLDNASPATVSRAGIIYVSDTDLGWTPIVDSWIATRPGEQKTTLKSLFTRYVGEESPTEPGLMFDFIGRKCVEGMKTPKSGRASSCLILLQSLLDDRDVELSASFGADAQNDLNGELEKFFLYSVCWSIGGLLEADDRTKFDQFLREIDDANAASTGLGKMMPECTDGDTIFEYKIDLASLTWKKWVPPQWEYPQAPEGAGGDHLDFSNLLVPTLDSTRGQFVVDRFHQNKRPVLLVGSSGTAKTSTINMFFQTFDADVRMSKTITFSFVTKCANCQLAIELSLDKRGGKTFGPPNGMKLTVFLDDLSMPEINEWGDQPTLEIVRQLMEFNGFAFLDKDKRGSIKLIEDVQYVSAMSTPGGGKNEIPQRLKRHFGIITMVLPSITAIDDIYGQMLRGRFTKTEFDNSTLAVVDGLTRATIELWRKVKSKLLPTPAKFHYVFNLRDLSRIFAGVLMTPKNTIINGGTMKSGQDGAQTLLGLWRHECERVFCDKLTNKKDKSWYTEFMKRHLESHFPAIADAIVEEEELYFVDFLKDDVYDEDGILSQVAPKIYEDGGTLESIRERVEMYMGRYNDTKPPSPLNLVLFDDALRHMIRISRIIETPRGSALLVGVGGSGKQSLTRLAAYVGRHTIFQITLTKSYNLASLYEDIKELYVSAGKERKNTTFLFTDSEIKDEMFLEAINNILMTGQIPGLFAKDEMIAMTGDLADDFMVERPHLDPTQLNLNSFFYDCVRDNLHMVICMSPKNPKFPVRARNFPGIISGCTIDWFLAWPEQALVAVSSALIGNFQIETTDETKAQLVDHMGAVHTMADATCEEYFEKVRRSMYQTPKSYLSFIHSYKKMYTEELKKIKQQRENITLGLEKLIEGAKGVAEMKIVLEKEQIKLDQATKDTEKMLAGLQVSSMEAKKEADSVDKIKKGCEADATRISGEKALCEEDLAKAQPFVDEANNAIASIKPGDIQEVKVLKKPADIIKLVFDLLLLLFIRPLDKVQKGVIKASKQEWDFIEPSWNCAKPLMGDKDFLKNLIKFGEVGKDQINQETVELMMPYIDQEYFTPDCAGGASKAARGLCTFARAMKFYYEASKIVKPKLEALAIAAGELAEANKKLAQAEVRLEGCNQLLQGLKEKFEKQMRAKQEIEEGALKLKRKMNAASALIGGLAGEQIRWTEDAANFGIKIDRLVGDCAVSCAFTSYVGGFNQDFRAAMVKRFISDLQKREVPVTDGIDVCEFMVDVATQGEWCMQGLPTDPLSIQNGVLVTNARRYPLMIDPQGQAISWLAEKEKERIPAFGIVQLDDNRLKEKLEFAMAEGGALIVAGVNEEIDPMLDPVLEKQIVRKGKTLFINVADQFLEYNPKFSLFFISRLPNPHFSPELQAKTTIIDFTVTMKGLEEQLLGRVISKEQSALEEQLTEVIATVTSNTKSLQLLDQQLLDRLTSNTGSLLDDPELIDVLAATKQKAAEVKIKLKEAGETREGINEKREQVCFNIGKMKMLVIVSLIIDCNFTLKCFQS